MDFWWWGLFADDDDPGGVADGGGAAGDEDGFDGGEGFIAGDGVGEVDEDFVDGLELDGGIPALGAEGFGLFDDLGAHSWGEVLLAAGA